MTEHIHQSIQGWSGDDVVDLYRAAVARAPERGTLVEVGCWKGRSLCALLVEAANAGKRQTVYGIDHFQGSPGEPALQEEAHRTDLYAECYANCLKASYPYFRLIKLPSVEAARYEFRAGTVDFLFLDAAHDYASVAADLKAWLPKMAPGGLLAGHDVNGEGVRQAVDELVPGWTQRESCWLWEVPDAACEADV
jgi:hypothetical protein